MHRLPLLLVALVLAAGCGGMPPAAAPQTPAPIAIEQPPAPTTQAPSRAPAPALSRGSTRDEQQKHLLYVVNNEGEQGVKR
ncbi:MAG TPA: hypothetical protein VK464_18940, partial [Symbiobacteriaceae bacterium]|nr:hypothetical protein [Symbiobacteriaceae bacterium]